MSSDSRLTVMGHLLELRQRLIRSVIAVAITTALSFAFYNWIFYVLLRPAEGYNLIYTEVTEMVGVIMKVCLAAGIILAMPYLIFQFVMFVSPALTTKEKRYVYVILPWVAIMFLGGIAFGYFVLLPPGISFLLSVGSDIATAQIKIDNYISTITRLLLAIGLVFEMPVVSTFLARLGVLKPNWLASKRKIAVVMAFVLGAIITPTFDPINQSLVALPLIVLYELSIWLAKLVYKKRASEPAVEPVTEAQ